MKKLIISLIATTTISSNIISMNDSADFNLKKIKEDLKTKISPNFNLTVTNQGEGSISISVTGYEKDKNITPNLKSINFHEFYKKHDVPVSLTDFICNYKGYGKTENGYEKTKKIISEFSDECTKKLSKIVYVGFGTFGADKEFATLFSIFSENNKNISIEDIHLIDPAYHKMISCLSKNDSSKISTYGHENLTSEDLENTSKKLILYGTITDNNLNKIIDYFYLLNKKLKHQKKPIRLFFHEDVNSYLKCIAKNNLDKANCISSWYPIKINKKLLANMIIDLIKLISNGAADNCLFLHTLDETSVNIPKQLNKENIKKYVGDLANLGIYKMSKEEFLRKTAEIIKKQEPIKQPVTSKKEPVIKPQVPAKPVILKKPTPVITQKVNKVSEMAKKFDKFLQEKKQK